MLKQHFRATGGNLSQGWLIWTRWLRPGLPWVFYGYRIVILKYWITVKGLAKFISWYILLIETILSLWDSSFASKIASFLLRYSSFPFSTIIHDKKERTRKKTKRISASEKRKDKYADILTETFLNCHQYKKSK